MGAPSFHHLMPVALSATMIWLLPWQMASVVTLESWPRKLMNGECGVGFCTTYVAEWAVVQAPFVAVTLMLPTPVMTSVDEFSLGMTALSLYHVYDVAPVAPLACSVSGCSGQAWSLVPVPLVSPLMVGVGGMASTVSVTLRPNWLWQPRALSCAV